MFVRHTAVLLLACAIVGCANLAEKPDNDAGIDDVACVGHINSTPAGLEESKNSVLQGRAQLASDKGGVCAAKVYSVTAPVVLYRVFDSSNPYSEFGSWWALKRPAGTKDGYRAANAICKEWSNLDRVVSCEVRPGSQIVIGTTQSAVCADGSVYSKTAENQVYVPNDGRAGIVHVGACSEEAVWP